jgi:hypothetical protein
MEELRFKSRQNSEPRLLSGGSQVLIYCGIPLFQAEVHIGSSEGVSRVGVRT